MDFPEDKETMHSFLGLVNFLNKYLPKLTELCSLLRKLILKDIHYTVQKEHRNAFLKIKEEFCKKIVLPYFYKNPETVPQTDASKKYFGAVTLQEEKPIYFASRSLISAEQNYHNLEREAMAAVWAWRNSTIFSMERNSPCKLQRKLESK